MTRAIAPTTGIEAKINAMYALHNRIEAALVAQDGPIEKWDEDYGVGLSRDQYKSLAATMAEWFMDWIKDEGMVRTPGTVEISRENLWQARIWVALWLTDDDVDTDEVDRVVDVIDAALAKQGRGARPVEITPAPA